MFDFFGGKQGREGAQTFNDDLDHILLRLGSGRTDHWTIGDAVRGAQIFGGIGSGKSSGSGQNIALSFLKNGLGGLVLTGKIDETEAWIDYAKKAGRENDLVIFSPECPYSFNPLDYEMTRPGKGGRNTDNITALFSSIMKMSNRAGGNSSSRSGSSDPFWELSSERLTRESIDLIKLSRENLTISNIVRVISEAPIGGEFRRADFKELTISDSDEDKETLHYWCRKSYTVFCLAKALQYDLSPQEELSYDVALDYFLADFIQLAENTRTSITEHFYSFANPFRSGLLAEKLGGVSSPEVMPEETFNGKIIILDFPVKQHLTTGVYVQSIFKRIWQQAVERRDLKLYPKPVFLWVDEAQYFLCEEDMMFQTTARSSKACTVFISQSISNYYATMGGDSSKSRVDALLGNLSTKIFHANQDHVTNRWAAETIGKVFKTKTTVNAGSQPSTSFADALEYQIEPQEFTTLIGGGKANDFKVQGVVTVTGKTWSTGKNYIKTSFSQKPKMLTHEK